MRLLRVELGRLRSRRAVVLLALVGAALTALLTGSVVLGTQPPDAEELARAEQLVEQERETVRVERERCLADPEGYVGPGSTAEDCGFLEDPQVEWFLDTRFLDLAEEVPNTHQSLVVLLAGLALLAAATFAGADWSSGSMGNQLLFEPRRLRMWATKAVAVAVAATVVAAVLVTAFWAVLAGVAAGREVTTSAAEWRLVAEGSLRGLALVAACALGSYALAMLLRSTVGAVGVLFGYVVVVEALVATLPVTKMSQWSLPNNVSAWLEDGIEVYDESLCPPGDACEIPTYLLTAGHASAYLGVLLVLAVAASLVAFRRRDV